jgi:acetyl/propionyl-CoA carboxylase alpha subunit/acetyl-CoA carboxylase carboxyltransferase component
MADIGRQVERLAVVDTGESAVRVLTAVGGLNATGDAPPITTVLFHGDAEPRPWYAREADEVRPLVDASGSSPEPDATPTVEHVVSSLGQAVIDTVWLGSSVSNERIELIEACESAGIAVVGPGAETLRRLDSAVRHGATDWAPTGPVRRVEIDVIADHHGTVWNLGGRDVSVRRASHTMLAEAPCASISDEMGQRLRSAATELARAVDLRGAAVITYLHDGVDFALHGVDGAAPPDHATTEERTGASIIGWRLRVHRGEALPSAEPAGDGVVVEARLHAEDFEHSDTATSAAVALLSFPVGTGVRVDANRRAGDPVTPDDSLLAVVSAWGPNRAVALGRVQRALERTAIVLDGATTNRTTLLDLLAHDDFTRGATDQGWADRVLADRPTPPPEPVALLAAAVEAYESDRRQARTSFFASAARGRPQQPVGVGEGIELGYAGTSYRLDVRCVGHGRYSVHHGSTVADVSVDELDAFERRIACGGRRHRVITAPSTIGYRVEVGSTAHHIIRHDGTVVRAGWPALVVQALVEPGDEVVAGDPVAVLESMKMETTVTAPVSGVVVSVDVTPNSQVERGAALLRLRSPAGTATSGDGGRPELVDLSGLKQPIDFTRKPCERVYGPLGDYLLGYDLAPAELRKLLTQQRRMAEIAEPGDAALIACEDSLLDIVAELGSLYRPQSEAETGTENTQEYLLSFLQWLDADRARLSESYRQRLLRALGRFDVRGLEAGADLESALMWLFRSLSRLAELTPIVLAILERRLEHRDALIDLADADMGARLDRLVAATQGRQQLIADLARDVRFHYFDEPPLEAAAAERRAEMVEHLDALAADPDRPDRNERLERLLWCPEPLRSLLTSSWQAATLDGSALREVLLDVHIRRFYRICELGDIRHHQADGAADGVQFASADFRWDDRDVHLVVGYLPLDELPAWSAAIAPHLATVDASRTIVVDLVTWRDGVRPDIDELSSIVAGRLGGADFGRPLHRVDFTVSSAEGPAEDHLRTQHVTFSGDTDGGFDEDRRYRNLHPMLAERLEMWRLSNFELERRPSPEDVYLFDGVAHDNPRDHRLFALAEVRELGTTTDAVTGSISYPRLERVALLAVAAMRAELTRYAPRDRPVANRLVLSVREPWTLSAAETATIGARFAPLAARVGLEKAVLKVRVPDPGAADQLRDAVLHIEDVGNSVVVREERAGDQPVRPLGSYRQKVLTAARFGSPYPYEITRLLTDHAPVEGLPRDSFQELELEAGSDPQGVDDRLVAVDREPGNNTAHVVLGVITNHTAVVPEGMRRMVLLSDPTQGLGNLAEPECRRINAALASALEQQIPVEWFAVSSGALIAMDSGTENMDWIALTLRRLIEFTQAGGEVNIVVTGINVGGQPYWNAEATMLTHTKGILVMSPASTMVLTGKQALDFSGAVSAEDNFGIGGYDAVMGPNGQAQYWAPSFPAACELLLRHYELTYVVPGERFPRRHATPDPTQRDVRSSPHAKLAASPFTTVGDVFSAESNPDRKQPFDMRSVMAAVADSDRDPLERWKDLRDGDTSIVWDTTIGGIPVLLLGLESHTVARTGYVPADGPSSWTSGTLFPHSSRKTARAINAATGNRPLVVLANLSGFDGSPESMRRRQLEFGAEIGRAVTNFDGPIVFVVVSRYHGGAFVVFSKALNESMEIAAVEGSFASVIGGAPAAATVFAREVKQRTERDTRVQAAREALAAASGTDAAVLRSNLTLVTEQVRSEKLGEVADEFDGVHTIERALRVGSVDRIIPAAELRPYVIDALERGMVQFT